jgi:DNA-binding beta-propeller fold protein YncE
MIKQMSQYIRTTLLLLLFITQNTTAQTTPGSQGYLLSNGWMITPEGKQIETDDMPMSVLVEPKGIFAFVLTAGWNDHGVTVIDIGHNKKIQHISLKTTWQGLAFDANKNQLYASGGTRPIIERIAYNPCTHCIRHYPS